MCLYYTLSLGSDHQRGKSSKKKRKKLTMGIWSKFVGINQSPKSLVKTSASRKLQDTERVWSHASVFDHSNKRRQKLKRTKPALFSFICHPCSILNSGHIVIPSLYYVFGCVSIFFTFFFPNPCLCSITTFCFDPLITPNVFEKRRERMGNQKWEL